MKDFDEIFEKIVTVCKAILMISAAVLSLVFAVSVVATLFK